MNTNTREKVILSSIGEAEKEVRTSMEVPAGYVEVRLSTKGRVGAPAVVHVRNFRISDIIALSMSDRISTPTRLINILNDAIFENTDVAHWHEKEIEELMVYIFLNFYSGVLKDVQFPVNEDDIEYIKKQPGGDKKIKDLNDGLWVPRVDINIARDVDIYDVPDDYNPRISIINKKTGLKVVFDYIKYGDQLVIKDWLDSYFANEENKFAKVRKQIEINNNLSRQFLEDPSSVDKYIEIDKDEENAYMDYLVRRTQTITDVAHIVSIVEIDGEDISGLSVGEKYEKLCNDARIDYNLIAHLSKRQAKVPIGIKPDVQMVNPITNEVVKRPFSFRVPVILQALQLSGPDDDDDGFIDEN